MPNTEAAHLEKITAEIKSMRGWLDYLERDIAANPERGVISAVVLASISESSMKLIYNAAVVNGAALFESELPIDTREAIRKAESK